MVTRLRKSIENKDKGFTLIELLVVIVIIGILAAIAIPIFLNQRKKAADAGVKSDVRQVATQLESAFTDNNLYPSLSAGSVPTTGNTLTINNETVKLSPGDVVQEIKYNGATASATTAFCVRVTSNVGTNTTGYVWESDNGGLQPSTVTACPGQAVDATHTSPSGYFTSAVGIQ